MTVPALDVFGFLWSFHLFVGVFLSEDGGGDACGDDRVLLVWTTAPGVDGTANVKAAEANDCVVVGDEASCPLRLNIDRLRRAWFPELFDGDATDMVMLFWLARYILLK
jgi:hypothetical protein